MYPSKVIPTANDMRKWYPPAMSAHPDAADDRLETFSDPLAIDG